MDHLKSKPSMPDNAEPAFKCSVCGNMFTADEPRDVCDVCGKAATAKNEAIFASNEDY